MSKRYFTEEDRNTRAYSYTRANKNGSATAIVVRKTFHNYAVRVDMPHGSRLLGGIDEFSDTRVTFEISFPS